MGSNCSYGKKIQIKDQYVSIRIIDVPLYFDLHYFPQQDQIALIRNDKIYFYSIDGNMIKKIIDKTEKFNKNYPRKGKQTFLLDNSIFINCVNHVRKYNIENLSEFQIIKCRLPIVTHNCTLINKKSFMMNSLINNKLRIFQLRNFKQSHTLVTKLKILSTQYNNFIVQAFRNGSVYYFNTKMTKQIRRYHEYNQLEPSFNSHFLFVPIHYRIQLMRKLFQIQIYDIRSMKVYGILQLSNRQDYQFDSCLFIKEYNIIAIMYQNNIDFFQFYTLKYLVSEKFDKGRQQIMKYHKQNGLSIFKKIWSFDLPE